MDIRSALNLVANRHRTPRPAKASLAAKVSQGKLGEAFGLAVALDVKLPGMDKSLAGELVAKAHTVCPYSSASRHNVDVARAVSVA